MSNDRAAPQSSPVPTPSRHQLALMIWLCVFPTLTIVNLVLGDWLRTLSPCCARSFSPPLRSRSSSTGSCHTCIGSAPVS